jgi:hypothetical protein
MQQTGVPTKREWIAPMVHPQGRLLTLADNWFTGLAQPGTWSAGPVSVRGISKQRVWLGIATLAVLALPFVGYMSRHSTSDVDIASGTQPMRAGAVNFSIPRREYQAPRGSDDEAPCPSRDGSLPVTYSIDCPPWALWCRR